MATGHASLSVNMTVLAGGAQDKPGWKFPCLLTLAPAPLEGPAPFLGALLHFMYRSRFANQHSHTEIFQLLEIALVP